MERLPYIDAASAIVDADRERTWAALIRVARGVLGESGGPLARVLGVQPSRSAGSWTEDVQPGAALPGFAVVEAARPTRLALAGRHRFSRYELVFELDDAGPGNVRLRAMTWAAFPGVAGRAYRALVIGTGGHRLAVRGILRRVARRAATRSPAAAR